MHRRSLRLFAASTAIFAGIALTLGCTNPPRQVRTDPGQVDPPAPSKGEDPSNPRLYDTQGTHKVKVSLGKEQVPVDMYVPSKRSSNTLVVLLHGSGGNGPETFRKFEYGRFHEAKGVAVMAPSAELHERTGKTRWNSGQLDDIRRDDLALLETLAKKARESGKIDKVVAIGFSNGAQMTNRWACEGTQVDAVVTAAGTLAVDPSKCKRQVPIMTFVGDKDFRLEDSPSEDGSVPSVNGTMELWRKINKCSDKATEEKVGKRVCRSWSCETPTKMCVVRGLEHQYPTPKNCGVDANEEGWDFLGKAKAR